MNAIRFAVGWGAGVLLAAIFSAAQLSPDTAQAQDMPYPAGQWQQATPAEVGLDGKLLGEARDYALTAGGSGHVVRHGRLVMSWGDTKQRYDLKSTTKSIGVTALGLAILDGKIALEDRATRHHPSLGVPPDANRATQWLGEITILHLATQTAGFEKPGGYTKLEFAPGTKWSYSDGGPNWLAECVTLAYGKDVDELMFERVFGPLGITRDDLVWRQNSYREARLNGIMRREFGSGVSANTDAMARIGLLYLRGGTWRGQQILPRQFVQAASRPVPAVVGLPELDPERYGNASDHYGLLWWNNADGTLKEVPRDAYWSWGLYDSLIVVIPSLDLVVARAGKSWQRAEGGDHYDVLKPFLSKIVAAAKHGGLPTGVKREQSAHASPDPHSSGIIDVHWAPVGTIVRLAPGGDNWPMTWADDDHLYTAYGDGQGFEPHVPEKLSMGLSRVEGMPPKITGINVRSESFEREGDGKRGPKVSSLLMVDHVLYALVRNTGNSQLAWSRDHGRTWQWSAWKFEVSFGYPVFLNFGRDYAGARDRFVYVYSHDSDSAYERADRMVLARAAGSPHGPRRVRVFRTHRRHRPSGMDSRCARAWRGL